MLLSSISLRITKENTILTISTKLYLEILIRFSFLKIFQETWTLQDLLLLLILKKTWLMKSTMNQRILIINQLNPKCNISKKEVVISFGMSHLLSLSFSLGWNVSGRSFQVTHFSRNHFLLLWTSLITT
jgi:hypothetical protein